MARMRNRDGVWPYLALVAGVLCIAWSAIFVRWTEMPGTASALYRMLIPTLILLPTFWLGRGGPRLSSRNLFIIAIGGLFFALDLALYNSGILRTTAANATLLGNNTPVFVGIFGWLFYRSRPPLTFWLGLLLASCGSLVIVRADLARHLQFGAGDVMALAAGACFAVYLMATEQVRAHSGTTAFLRLAAISSTIFLLLFAVIARVPLHVPSRRAWLALLGLGLLTQLGGYFALTYALGHLPATINSVTLLAQVPLTAALAALLLGEPLTRAQILGGAIVLLGVGLANRRGHPEDEVNTALGEPEHELAETS
jgi:drug/metabolite transporter (DMT)-like permease